VSAAAIGLPQVNQLVRLRLPGSTEDLPSRVELAEPGALWVAAPFPDLHAEGRYNGPIGATVRVTWVGARGQCRVSARLADVRRHPRPLWQLHECGPVEVLQRRRHARVETDLRVLLNQPGPDRLAVIGQTVDVSEGAFRCHFAGPLPNLEVGEDMMTTFELDGTHYQLPGSVLSIRGRKEGGTDVVLLFDQPVGCAQELRRFVLQTQIRYRRNWAR
jgi:hypothetical protein